MKSIIITSLFMFLCSCDRTYDHGGLNWSHPSLEMNWYDAQEYCKDLGRRLPTISELRGLIQDCPEAELGGSCRISDDCLSSIDCDYDKCCGCDFDWNDTGKYDSLGFGSILWSSSVDSSDPDYVYLVFFDEASIGRHKKTYKCKVCCVKE
ncbi:MAG TPA: hypothetical protein PLD55_07880 [bacterium]|nr:hypothetical protein [bacterium]HNZ54397.1 hypothetical protein [bacterium]HOG43717.1 hypothetical protein [bacterium]HPM47839.1 hypothetical protein [bacterium]HPY13514.1 hypothetical protein [bacterium]